jgi:hypothetical protein
MIRSHPKRLTPPARPGELLKRFDAPAPQRSVKHDGEREPGYLEFVRACPCLYCGMDPAGEAAHVRFASAAFGKASGLQKKPDDRWALPLCGPDHRTALHAQHNHNEENWWIAIGINPLIVAERLHKKAGDLVAMRAVVMVAIAERSKK